MEEVKVEVSGEMNVPKQEPKSQFDFSSFTQFQKIPSPLELIQLTRKYIRPWSVFLNTSNFKTAASMPRMSSRFLQNLSYFQSNYIFVFIVLMIYCLITSPLILLVLAAVAYASHRIRKAQIPISLFGHQLTTKHQIMAVEYLLQLEMFTSGIRILEFVAEAPTAMQIDLVLCMRFMGEFTGTALLMCLGCLGYACTDQPLQTSLHLGLVVMIVVHCFGFVSGAHANPCISLACSIMGYITVHMMCVYILAQFLGATFGYYLVTLLLPEGKVYGKPGLCMTVPDSSVSSEQAFAIEYLLTSILILGWCSLWDVRNTRYLDSISIRVGLLVTACCLAGGQLTGASMNPARTLAPAIFQNDFETIGIYFVSQFLAGVTMPYIWWYLFIPRCRFSFRSMDNDNGENESRQDLC